MPYAPIALPPGQYANGTAFQAKGRWRLQNLVRWPDGTNMQPVNGWRQKGSASALSAKARAIHTWRDNSALRWAMVGTSAKLQVFNAAGTAFDITPVGFTAGSDNATTGSGYGTSTYGTGTYGTPRPDSTSIVPASVWCLDQWSQYGVGCMEGDGKAYEWTLATGTPAAVISGAPTGLNGIMVTGEKFMFAFTDRNVAWSDQGTNTTWTPAATNQAGDFDLTTQGSIMCGKRVRGANLVFTDVDCWAATYRADIFIYNFERVGENCGLLGKNAVVSLDGRAFWMGRGAFFVYNGGSVDALECEVSDYVFQNINEQQSSKATAWYNVDFGEVWWHYPSASATENDSYVMYSTRTGRWAASASTVARTCGAASGVFQYPLLMGADNKLYEHEVGWGYDNVYPYAQSGPVELGTGDNIMNIAGFIGDEGTQGESRITVYTRNFPNEASTTWGPYTFSTAPTCARINGRQAELKVEFIAAADSRFGVMRLDMQQGGRR